MGARARRRRIIGTAAGDTRPFYYYQTTERNNKTRVEKKRREEKRREGKKHDRNPSLTRRNNLTEGLKSRRRRRGVWSVFCFFFFSSPKQNVRCLTHISRGPLYSSDRAETVSYFLNFILCSNVLCLPSQKLSACFNSLVRHRRR